MKSIDVRKIAAITFGAALLGASVLAAAPVTVDNVDVISAEGVPLVQIVVGNKAAASDGVAAANIAAVIGSLSYKTRKVSAKLQGSPECSAAAAGGAGSCSITVGTERVGLDVYTPGGTIAGAYPIKTYMYGFVDSDTTDDQLKDSNQRTVDSNYWTALADATTTDSTSSKTYTVKYKIYTGTLRSSEFDTSYNKFKTFINTLDYVTTFDESSYAGIPACTKSDVITNVTAGITTTSAMTDCAETYLTSGHRVQIKYLGENWIISAMTPPTTNATTGGSIKLAKESVPEQRMYVGQNMTTDKYVMKLETVSVPYTGAASQASIKFFNKDGTYTGVTKAIGAGTTQDVTIGTDTLSVHVYEVLAGLTPLDSWVRAAVYTQEITLTNNAQVDSSDNTKWKVYLTWGNYSSGVNIILKNINLSRTGMPVALLESDSLPIIGKPNMYQLYFAGQTLGATNLEKLTVTYTSSATYDDEKSGDYINTLTGRDYVCIASDAKSAFKLPDGSEKRKVCFGNGPVLYEKTAGSGDMFALETQQSSATVISDGTAVQPRNVTYWSGAAFTNLHSANITMKELYSDYAGTGDLPVIGYTNITLAGAINNTVVYKVTASNDSLVPIGSYAVITGAISNNTQVLPKASLSSSGLFAVNTSATWPYRINDDSSYDKNIAYNGSLARPTLDILEYANKDRNQNISFGLFVDFVTDKALYSSAAAVTTDEVSYAGLNVETGAAATATAVKAGYVGQKGSKVVSKSKTEAVFNMAKKLGELEYDLKPTSATAAAGGTTSYTKGVNESITVGDSTVTVKTVAATTSACSVTGGNATCTAAVSAVPTLDGEIVAADTVVAKPYAMTSAKKLVVLDSETPTMDTLILIGGPAVNTLTAEELKAQPGIKLDAAGKKVSGKITDKKILVAGYLAKDTTDAATELIKKLLGE